MQECIKYEVRIGHLCKKAAPRRPSYRKWFSRIVRVLVCSFIHYNCIPMPFVVSHHTHPCSGIDVLAVTIARVRLVVHFHVTSGAHDIFHNDSEFAHEVRTEMGGVRVRWEAVVSVATHFGWVINGCGQTALLFASEYTKEHRGENTSITQT